MSITVYRSAPRRYAARCDHNGHNPARQCTNLSERAASPGDAVEAARAAGWDIPEDWMSRPMRCPAHAQPSRPGGTVFVSSAPIRGGRLAGEPPTQGDKFRDPRTNRLIEQKHARLTVWRRLIAAAIQGSDWQPIGRDIPVHCRLEFVMPRPQDHYGTGRNAGQLRAAAPLWHAYTPDLDKLCRAVFDGLGECAAIHNDAQIVMLTTSKRYTSTGDVGVRITCEPIPEGVQP